MGITVTRIGRALGATVEGGRFDGDDVVDAAITRARSYAENAPSSLQLTKRLLTENASETDLDLVQRREGRANEEAGSTPEHREAVNAFLEKRAPKFR